jgi:hypothetical protein
MIGHRPDSLWLTRLDMSLPRSALERDCTIASASSQASISSVIQAEGVANAPCPVLASSGADVGSGLKQLPIWALALLLLSGGILRRSLRPNS